MAGIYIHIPFCRKACHYCNFHFSTSLHQKPPLVAAIANEIERSKLPANLLPERTLTTIYFGGGTPSLLEEAELALILQAVSNQYEIDANAEITLEANPDDINGDKLETWSKAGINRLSIGVQSFDDDDLRWMNRAHNALQAKHSIELAKSFGFNDLTLDLIYGTPTLSDSQWEKNIQTAVDLGVNHLSCYALTVEEKTALKFFIQKGKVAAVDENNQSRQFDLLMERAAMAGFEHYEVSNFAKPGHRSKHNSNYWSGSPYYGFGPAAHSFDGRFTRWWNIANNRLYTEAIKNNEVSYSVENLSPKERFNEQVMTGLRTMEGIDLDKLEQFVVSNKIDPKKFYETAEKLKHRDLLAERQRHLLLTQKGMHFADGIASDLFISC